jgi:hypothetical protein
MTNRALAKLYQVPENKEGRPTTAKGELDLMVEKLAEAGHPDRVLELVQDIRSLDYNLNTQIPNWKPSLDGRVHTTWGYLAASGQLNSVRPNVLNLSRWTDEGQRFRRIIEAPYGYSFLEFDHKSYHVSTLGYCADDPTYIRFSQLDPHTIFASQIIPRDWCKPITLDLPDSEIMERSSWLKRKCKEMKATIGVDFRQDVAKNTVLANQLGQREWNFYRKHRKYIASVEEAKRLQDTLNDMFPLVTAFKNNIREIAYDGGKQIEGGMARRMRERWGGPKFLLLKEWGVVDYFFDVFNWRFKPKSRSFEKVHGTDSERAIAFPVQGEAFGMLKYEIRGMNEKGYLERYGFINTIHDSVVFLCRDALLASAVSDVSVHMSSTCSRMVLPSTGEALKVGVEASVGKNLQSKDYFGEGTNPEGMEEVRV